MIARLAWMASALDVVHPEGKGNQVTNCRIVLLKLRHVLYLDG